MVLTSLLAIVGVLFLMATRIDKMSSSATSEGRELAFAVDTVLAQISEDLVEDVPGVTSNQEYYDYPDALNAWLADLEPYAVKIAGDPNQATYAYYWRQISDVGAALAGATRDVPIRVVAEREPVLLTSKDPNGTGPKVVDPNALADADGDGVSDAKWFELPGDMSSRGRPIYAAVRIVDNGAMLNVNTGYATGDVLDPCSTDISRLDGSTQLQVNVLTLVQGVTSSTMPGKARELRSQRTNRASNPPEASLAEYEKQVIWRYLDVLRSDANAPYVFTPFDTADELELRYRFLLNFHYQGTATTRVETWAGFGGISVPREDPGDLKDWYLRAAADGLPDLAPALDRTYAYRHVATTYNMDRLITPSLPVAGLAMTRRMLNVNMIYDPFVLRDVIKAVLETANPGMDMGVEATQITVNLLDYIDDDDRVTVMAGPATSTYYGFERPCVYISEVAARGVPDPRTGLPHLSYAIELFKPYFEDADPPSPSAPRDEWRIRIYRSSSRTDDVYPFTWGGHGTRRFQVVLAEDPLVPLRSLVTFKSDERDDGEPVDPLAVYGYSRAQYDSQPQIIDNLKFGANDVVYLERRITASDWQAVDRSIPLPADIDVADTQVRSIQRNTDDNKCAWRQWSPTIVASPNLGLRTPPAITGTLPALPPLQAHPANKPLTNIGELGKILVRNGYSLSPDMAVPDILVDLHSSLYAELFNYLTVINPDRYRTMTDPNGRPIIDPSRPPETRVMGRININTAPSFVLAQLPWMGYAKGGPTDAVALQRARAIVTRRNKGPVGTPYRSIGELMETQIPPNPLWALGADGADDIYPAGPDLTPDTALDDFEERDLIFTRISNLVTVRSDVFTAYILVRLGPTGPQRRVVAILDRSGVNKLNDRVRIVAQQLVPDPR